MLSGMDYEKELRKIAERHQRLLDEAEACRLLLADSIREAAAAGVRQVDIVEATGYKREQIRRIVAGRTR